MEEIVSNMLKKYGKRILKEVSKKYNINYALMHTTNLYPTPTNLIRLNCLNILKKEKENVEIY